MRRCKCDAFDLSTEAWLIVADEAHTGRHCGKWGQIEGVFSVDHSSLTIRWRDGSHKTIEVQRAP